MSKAVIIPECNKDLRIMKEEISLSPTDKKDGAIGLFSRLLRLDPLGKRHSAPESPTATEPPTTYYGVFIPCEIKKGPDEEAIHVYKNKSEALELVKRYKSARFKVFRSHQDAVSFALRGAEPAEPHEGNNNSLMGEKPYPFKAPSPQDMVSLRKAIEAGLATTVRDRVWDNPRYLVSSGNTPAIVHEGSRYNALHIAAKSANAEICDLLLTTVGDPAFVQTLYGVDADADACKEFAGILVDRYLNTPDKAMNETPLHFAAKFGAEHVVDVLTALPQCNRLARNKYGEVANDIICNRAPNAGPDVARRIGAMLQERYYVPVLHSEDGSAAPTIGRPFTPAQPPEINSDPLSPRYEIRAFAGPMEARAADAFRRRWKTPPRSARAPAPSFRLQEMTKGLENVGRNLAEQMKVGWKEYWPFLDTFTDLRSPEGLALLETYLKNKYEMACSFALNDSFNRSQHSPDESLSRISLGNLSQHSPAPDTALSPISELCVALKTCKISSDRAAWKKTDPVRQRLCRQPNAKPIASSNGDSVPATNHTVSQLLCIERTCLVFAKRIADALIFSLTAEPEVAGESLKSEAKHLQHTIHTYMDDERFRSIDFALIHSRLAQLVVFKLREQTKELDDINNLAEFLVKLRCPNDDIFSSDDERKPFAYRTSRVRAAHVIECHVRCLAGSVCEALEGGGGRGPAAADGECEDIWRRATKCRCDWAAELFDRHSKKNASFRKNRSALSTSPKSESFIRRLTFDHNDNANNSAGDGRSQHSDPERPVNVNSPAGDAAPLAPPAPPSPSAPVAAPALYTIDVAKCQIVDAEVSDDESVASCNSDSEDYFTAPEDAGAGSAGDSADDMEDASDRAIVEPFIYGEEPTKTDRLVFEALADCPLEADKFPHVFRWRHTVALYSPTERGRWQQPSLDESVSSLLWAASPRARTPRARTLSARCSTPNKDARDSADRTLPLQVSNWLRITGPNSPRSALATKNVGHNISFGF